ncbi:MAG TPA: PfkB family carbohydrate kinase [Candidatus Dormibacteraeota bacterium]|nr:PfkB family carbohydrate kinase [Candidatus Dormibacteraeota bacterium]
MHSSCDILGLGCAAVDDILFLPRYPAADAKVEVRERQRHCGGLTATALVAAARLGARCVFAGTLGRDEGSEFVLETFRREGIDTRPSVRKERAGPVRSVILVDEERQTRNIFYDTFLARHAGADARQPPVRLIERARVLLVDRFGIPGMIRAARIARASGVAVVADFESFRLPRFGELLALVNHVIVGNEFARAYTGARTPAEAAARLWRVDRAAVVITCGARGCWYKGSDESPARHLPAFEVKTVDTTGCGDVFHGAYAVALLRPGTLPDRLRFASAAAALKAMQPGGQAGIPTRAAVEAFLGKRA